MNVPFGVFSAMINGHSQPSLDHRGDGLPGTSLSGRHVHTWCGRGCTGSLSAGHTLTHHPGAQDADVGQGRRNPPFPLYPTSSSARPHTPLVSLLPRVFQGSRGLVSWSPQAGGVEGDLDHPTECGLAET